MGLPELTSDLPSPLIAAARSGDSHRWREKWGWAGHLCCSLISATSQRRPINPAASASVPPHLTAGRNFTLSQISHFPPLHIHPGHFQNFFCLVLAVISANIKIKLCRATIKNAFICLLSSDESPTPLISPAPSRPQLHSPPPPSVSVPPR